MLASSGTPGRRDDGTAASSALLPSSSALAKLRKLRQAASTSGSGARRRDHIAVADLLGLSISVHCATHRA